MGFSEIRGAAAALLALQQQAAKVVQDQAPNWRQDLIGTRREIAKRIAELSGELRTWAAPPSAAIHHAAVIEDASKVRQALAKHQASWSAVSVDPNDPGFQASVRDLRMAYDGLSASLRGLEASLATSS